MQSDKPVLSEIEHLRGKLTGEQLEAIKNVLERNEEDFSRHRVDIGCCNFVEHEIELEEIAVPHREGVRRMTPHKSEACRKEIETLLEYDMIEPSKSPWACGVVMAKKKGDQLRFCFEFRYLNSVTVKDAYLIPRIDESLSKLGDAKFFTFRFGILEGPAEEARQRQNRVRLRVGAVSMETDAVWSLQSHSHVSTVDGTCADRCDKEVRQSDNVLCG